MKCKKCPSLSPVAPRQGIALVVTLALIVLMTIVVVAFFSHATANRTIEESRSRQTEVRLLVASAKDYIIGKFLEEMAEHSVSPETGDFTPQPAVHIVPERLLAGGVSGNDANFTNLIRQSVSGADSNASSHSSFTEAANGRRITPERWNKPLLLGGDGFTNQAELPNWIYVTPDGISATPTNGAIGRFAYNVYDIGGLLNINVTGYRPGMAAEKLKGSLPGVNLNLLANDLDMTSLVDLRNPDYGSNQDDFRNYVIAARRNGFRSPVVELSQPAKTFTSNYFISRQDLLSYARVKNLSFSDGVIPFLTHFSRSLSAPSWTPSGMPLVRFPSGENRTVIHYRDDGTRDDYTVNGGAPLLQRRFSLGKLAWLTPEGPLAGINQAAIQSCFGVRWNPGEERWDYVGNTGGAVQSSIKTLTEVAAENRAPNFFEMLKAGILEGSLGVAAELKTLAGNSNKTLEENKDIQVLRIGTNIIDCSDEDNYPTRIALNVSGLTLEVAGVEDLPYLSNVLMASLRDGTAGTTNPSTGQTTITIQKCDLVLIPHFFNPHQPPPTSISSGDGGGPARVVAEVYSGAIDEVQVGQKSNSMSRVGVAKDLVTGDAITISEVNFEDFRANPKPAESGGSALIQHVPWVTSSGNVQVFPVFSYAADAPAPPYQTPGNTTQRVYFGEDLGIRLQYETPNGALKTYATIAGNEAVADSAVDGYTGPDGVTLQFDSGPSFLVPRIFGFTGADAYNGWHQMALWDPRTNRLGPSQGYTTGVFQSPPVMEPTTNYMRRALPATTSDGTVGSFAGGVTVQTLLGQWPEGNKSSANGRTDKSLTNTRDPDGIYRPADAWLGPDANLYRNLADDRRRPVILQRPFHTVAELGYVFRDVPWKTLSFFDESSGDAGLLDFFSVGDEASIGDDRVAMNTRQAAVLNALLQGVGQNPNGSDGISDMVSNQIANELLGNAYASGTAVTTIPQNVAALAKLLTKDRLSSITETIKGRREAVARALAGAVQTRTWNVLIDVVAQTGQFRAGAGTDEDNFIVSAEDRKWVSVAMDRYIGAVIDQQEENVDE